MLEMMNAITDQGEGIVLKRYVAAAALQAVKERYRPSLVAVESDYPNFTDTGRLTKSADAPRASTMTTGTTRTAAERTGRDADAVGAAVLVWLPSAVESGYLSMSLTQRRFNPLFPGFAVV